MKVHLFIFLVLMVTYCYSKSYISIGYKLTLAIPSDYKVEFSGRAILMETNYQMEPNFRVTLSVEPIKEMYTCSLQVFLGDVKVWNSGHYSQFYTSDECVLELTEDGDLELKGSKEEVGWRTGTSGQGVERLEVLGTGNLVLVDAMNQKKWQSFNFPTDVMLWGQRLDVATRLTSFPIGSTFFYTFQIEYNKIALYLCSGKFFKYSYWEFKPSNDRNISFIQVGSNGLKFFDDQNHKIAQIPPQNVQPLRFLALGNVTGNLGLYYYNPDKGKFEASFQAIKSTCDLPLACTPYGICTFSGDCSCISLLTNSSTRMVSGDCNNGVDMVELNGVSSVLREDNNAKGIDKTKEQCAWSCLEDCNCSSALFRYYSSYGDVKDSDLGECVLYKMVVGVKQVESGNGVSYLVKVPKGSASGGHGKSGIKRWILVLVGIVDALIILIVLGGLGHYFIRKRRKNLSPTDNRN